MACDALHLTLSADLESLKQLEHAVDDVLACGTKHVVSETTRYNVLLALHELCTNIVRHAYAGEPGVIAVAMHIDPQAHQLTIRVRDWGCNSFDATRLTTPELVEPALGGMGLWLMNQLMDAVRYRRRGEINEWLLVKSLEETFASGPCSSQK